MDNRILFVRCPLCGQDHLQGEVEVLNIEENEIGYDKLHYVCPVVNEQTSATIQIKL